MPSVSIHGIITGKARALISSFSWPSLSGAGMIKNKGSLYESEVKGDAYYCSTRKEVKGGRNGE
jgi:hypothetical protein